MCTTFYTKCKALIFDEELIVTRIQTELSCIKRPVFSKLVRQQSEWPFELSVGNVCDALIYNMINFKLIDRLNFQTLHNNCFYRPPVNLTQISTGIEKYSVVGIFFDHEIDKNCLQHDQIESWLRHLSKDDMLQQYVIQNTFWTHHVIAADDKTEDLGKNFSVFDIRYQRNFSPAQPVKVEFKLREEVHDGKIGYAIFLTLFLTIGSVEQSLFELINNRIVYFYENESKMSV